MYLVIENRIKRHTVNKIKFKYWKSWFQWTVKSRQIQKAVQLHDRILRIRLKNEARGYLFHWRTLRSKKRNTHLRSKFQLMKVLFHFPQQKLLV